MIEVEGRKVSIRGAQVVPSLKNFKGDKFGPSGQRDFVIMLDEEQEQVLTELGYHVFYFEKEVKETGEIQRIPELKIRVRFDKFPPEIYTLVGDVHGVQTQLDADTVEELNNLRFLECYITFTPYNWVVNGKPGTTAYLRTMYVVIPKKDFADLFEDM